MTAVDVLPLCWWTLAVLAASLVALGVSAVNAMRTVQARREAEQAAAAADLEARSAPVPLTPAAPCSGRDQCRVCGMWDLPWWDVADEVLELAGPDAYVAAYGTGRAHRDCALVVPFADPATAARGVQLVESVQRGSRVLVLGGSVAPLTAYLGDPYGAAPAGLWGAGSWASTFDIVEIDRCSRIAPGRYLAQLRRPVRRAYYTPLAQFIPIPAERLVHPDGRLYTHREMGVMCYCERCRTTTTDPVPDTPVGLTYTMFSLSDGLVTTALTTAW